MFAALPAIRGDHKCFGLSSVFLVLFGCVRGASHIQISSVFAAAAKPLITLLNFELRIVAIVTILQQAVTVRPALPQRSESSGPRDRHELHESRRISLLPKAWASAGAFSLLTPRCKVAHY
jgi:hypothetical protein